MLKQRQVGILFDHLVRAVGAGRFALVALPLAVLVVAPAASVHDAGVYEAADAVADAGDSSLASAIRRAFPSRAASSGMLRPQAPAVAQDATGVESGRPPEVARPPLKLTPEQHKVAKFVAKKYRIAVDDVQHLVAHAYRAAREFRLDPYLVLAVMSIESSFNPNARSSKGAQGLMQVLTRVHVDKFAAYGGPAAAFDPVANISVGSRILKEYLVREGTVEGALKSYVGAAMLSHDYGYGYKVLSERERIAAAAAGRPIPALPAKPPVVADEGSGVARITPVSGVPGEPKTAVPAALIAPDRAAGAPDGAPPHAPAGATHDAEAAAGSAAAPRQVIDPIAAAPKRSTDL